MSRFPELFGEAIDEVVIGEAFLVETLAEHIARHIVSRQRALRAEVRIEAQYPLERRTPVTGLPTQDIASLIGIAAASPKRVRRVVGVEASGINACPCAQGLVRTAATERLLEAGFADGDIDRILELVPLATHNQRGRGDPGTSGPRRPAAASGPHPARWPRPGRARSRTGGSGGCARARPVTWASTPRAALSSTCTATWALAAAASPAAASSLAMVRLSAERSCACRGSSASIRSATSSALASSTPSRSGRSIDSAWLTTISPPSYDRSIGQYGSGDRSSTHQSRFRSSTSCGSVTPNAAAVSASPTDVPADHVGHQGEQPLQPVGRGAGPRW